MSPQSMAKRLMEAMERDERKPAAERWDALVARGAIDEEGRVLLKAPSPMMGVGETRRRPPRRSRRRPTASRRRRPE